MDNVTEEKLRRQHGENAGRVFEQIADIGGFGKVGDGEGHISASYAGGLDVRGVLDPNNNALTDAQKSKIAELAGVKTEDRARIDSGATTSSADKIGKTK
jgi:hypothetical protein